MLALARRLVLAGAVATLALSSTAEAQVCGDAGHPDNQQHQQQQLCFPPNFLFGTSTSAQQVEGGTYAYGRTLSKWDTLCRNEGPCKFDIFCPDPNTPQLCSNVADDFVHQYASDLALMESDGYNAFRFSISWSRAMNWDNSTKRMKKNAPGIAFYHALIDDMLAKRMEPVLTIFHWDLPAELEDLGDFTNASIVDHFVEYSELLFAEFGHKVKYWATINEPMSYCYPFIFDNDPKNEFQVAHNLLLSHAAAVQRFRQRKAEGAIRSDAVISIVLSGFGAPLDAKNPKDVAAAERFVQYTVGWWTGPLTTGAYPAVMRERSGQYLPTFTAEQQAMIKGSYDLHMYNFYFANPVTDCDSPTPKSDCTKQRPGWTTDLGVDSRQIPNLPGQRNATGRCADHFGYPPDYLSAIEWIHAQDASARILLAENGWCGDDSIHNADQTWYFRTHLQQVHKAITEKHIPIVGYMAWSFMDNFEWGSYDNRYGLYHVDFPTNIGAKDLYDAPKGALTRTPRDAAKLMSGVAKSSCVQVLDEDTQFL